MARSGGCPDVVHRTGKSVGKWLCREFQRQAARRIAQWPDLRDALGSQSTHRTLAAHLQPDSPAQFIGLSTARSRDHRPSASVSPMCMTNRQHGTTTGGRSEYLSRYKYLSRDKRDRGTEEGGQ